MTSRAGQGLGPRCRWPASTSAPVCTISSCRPFDTIRHPAACGGRFHVSPPPSEVPLPYSLSHWSRPLPPAACCFAVLETVALWLVLSPPPPPPPLAPPVATLFSCSMSGIDQQVTGDVGGHTSLPGRAASPPMDMPGRRTTPGHREGEQSNISYLRIENGMGSGPSGGERGDMRVGTPDQTLTDHLDKVRGAGGLSCGCHCGRRVYAPIRLAVDFRLSGFPPCHAGAEQQLRVHRTFATDLTNVHCACLTPSTHYFLCALTASWLARWIASPSCAGWLLALLPHRR